MDIIDQQRSVSRQQRFYFCFDLREIDIGVSESEIVAAGLFSEERTQENCFAVAWWSADDDMAALERCFHFVQQALARQQRYVIHSDMIIAYPAFASKPSSLSVSACLKIYPCTDTLAFTVKLIWLDTLCDTSLMRPAAMLICNDGASSTMDK